MRLANMRSFFENQLRNEVDSADGGWLTDISPQLFNNWGNGDPAWVSALAGIASALYTETGDLHVPTVMYAAVQGQAEAFIASAAKSAVPDLKGLLTYNKFGDYLNIGCTWKIYSKASKAGVIPHLSNTPCNGVVDANHYYLQTVRVAALFAKVTNRTADYERYSGVAAQVASNYARAFAHPNDPKHGDLHALAHSNATQSLVSLVLSSDVLNSTDAVRYATALLNDFMGDGQNCLLYTCFQQRAHFTGGMTGFKATNEALQQLERIDEWTEAMTSREWPSFGYMLKHGATTLWESWGVVEEDIGGRPMREGVCATDDACISAGWLGGSVKYFYTMLAGMGQKTGTVGYKHPLFKPLVPRDAASVGSVSAHLETASGIMASSWSRNVEGDDCSPINSGAHADNSGACIFAFNVSIPTAAESATIVVPTLNASKPTIFMNGKKVDITGDTRHIVSGSYPAVAIEVDVPGRYSFAVKAGEKPPVIISAPPQNEGDVVRARCPDATMHVVGVASASYHDADQHGCSAGSSVYLVEQACLLAQGGCDVAVQKDLFDPANQTCVRNTSGRLALTIECGYF